MVLKIIKNMRYKYRVLIAITLFLIVTVVSFGTIFVRSYIERNTELRASELSKDTDNIMTSLENTFVTLYKYYLATQTNDEVKYIVENDVDYDQVSAITDAADTLSGNNIVSDYVSAYTLINFKTGTVLGSRGRYSTDEVLNLDEIMNIYDTYIETYTKNLWIYIDSEAPDKNSRDYRMTVPISGLDLILFVPYSEVTPYALFVINVNMNQITTDLKKQLQKNQNAVLYSADGEVIFSTDDELVKLIDRYKLGESDETSHILNLGKGKKVYVSRSTYSVAGLQLYVSYYNEGLEIFTNTYQVLGFVIVVLLLLLISIIVFYSIYKPIHAAASEIAKENAEQLLPGEDELKYLTNSVKRLDNKNEALIEHTTNLFAMRLYRNELTKEEIDQYIYRLSLTDKIPENFLIITLVLKMINEDNVISADEEKRICTEIIEELKKSVNTKKYFLPMVYYSRSVVAFVETRDTDEFKEIMLKNYNYIRQYIYNKYGMNIGIGISRPYTDIYQINEAYTESAQAIQHGKIDTGSFVSYYSEDSGLALVKYDEEKEQDLQRALRLGDKESAYSIIDEIFANLIGQKITRDNTIPILLQLVNSIVMEAQNSGMGMDVFREEVKDIYPVIIDYHDLNRVRKYIKFNMIDPVIYKQNQLIENQSGTIMAAIEQLVESKAGNITLNECSEILSYHTSYIWRVLKEEKNMTFTEYVEQYKLKLAKDLLTNSDMTVGAIAEKLSYTNAQNFIRFFNKMVGTTPGRFRQVSRAEQV